MNPITFVVRTGSNPVPYKRTTQRQMFADPDYKRYQAYKWAIKTAFMNETRKTPQQVLRAGIKYEVIVLAFYKNKRHADTDNVAKGVNDAIFEKPLSDKFIAGSYDFDYDKYDPRLVVTIREATYQKS